MELSPVYAEYEAVGRLDLLAGLTREVLCDAVESTYRNHVSNITELEPPTARGLAMWMKGTAALRERLIPLGWRYFNEQNLPLTVSRDGGVAIAINSGDEDTGRKDGKPRTASTKGKATKEAIDKDQLVLDIGEIQQVVETRGQQFWVLLVHVDQAADEIRLELSRPANVTRGEQIREWSERIILPLISLKPELEIGEEPPEEIDIDIRRRL